MGTIKIKQGEEIKKKQKLLVKSLLNGLKNIGDWINT